MLDITISHDSEHTDFVFAIDGIGKLDHDDKKDDSEDPSGVGGLASDE